MKKVKKSKVKKILKAHGMSMKSMETVVQIPITHLSTETLQFLEQHFTRQHPLPENIGNNQLYVYMINKEAYLTHGADFILDIEFVHSIKKLPEDLQACIKFAQKLGAIRISFMPRPECRPVKGLQDYNSRKKDEDKGDNNGIMDTKQP